MNRIQSNVLRNVLSAAAFVMLAGVMLAGCGNKGPLYLPPPPEPIDPATVPAEQPPADADSAEPAVEPATEPAQPTEDAGKPAETPEEAPEETPADTPEEVPSSDGNG